MTWQSSGGSARIRATKFLAHAAQVPAVHVARTLAAAEGRTATVSEEAHADRFTRALFRKHSLSLPIEIEDVEHEVVEGVLKTITTQHVTPESWIKYLMQEDPSLICGNSGSPQSNFRAFWTFFQRTHAEHEVFRTGKDLSSTIPILIHGDEGRSIKKTAYLVLSFESPIGCQDRRLKPCQCVAELAKLPGVPEYGEASPLPDGVEGPSNEMFTNYTGHSYLTRHLLFGLGGWIFKKNPHVVQTLLGVMADNLQKLFHQGLEIDGKRYFVAVAGIKGDMDFHRKYFFLDRSYTHVGSRSLGFICHCCMASSGDMSQHRFEDFAETPSWLQTMHRSRPWPPDQVPQLTRIPMDTAAPERALLHDPFHIVKLGLARDLIGSCVVVLCRKGFFDYPECSKNFPDRLARAHSSFVLFCLASKEHPTLRGFTKTFFNMTSFMSSPWTNSKGSDSMILLRYLSWFLRLQMKHPTVPGHGLLLDRMCQTCEACLDMFRLMQRHRLILHRPCVRYLYVVMMRLLRGFRVLSTLAVSMRMRAFALKPKAHSLHHVAQSLRSALLGGCAGALNPQYAATEVCEDFIGRVSRLSRRVDVRTVDRRVIERVFLKKRALMKKRWEAKLSTA